MGSKAGITITRTRGIQHWKDWGRIGGALVAVALDLPGAQERGENQAPRLTRAESLPRSVGVKLQLGQRGRWRQCKESAGGKCQGRTEKALARTGKFTEPNVKAQNAQRSGEGKDEIHEVASGARTAARGHKSADSHEIERLVQDDRHKCPESNQPGMARAARLRLNARRPGQCHQSGCGSSGRAPRRPKKAGERTDEPGYARGDARIRVAVDLGWAFFGRAEVIVGHVVVMEMEEALNKKHDDESSEQPPHDRVDGPNRARRAEPSAARPRRA